MIIVGGRISTSLKGIDPMVDSRDSEAISNLAVYQRNLGAHWIGVNAGTRRETEPDDTQWLVRTVQSATSLPVWIDTPSPEAMEAGLKVHDSSSGPPIVDSTTGEPERLSAMVSLARKYSGALVGLMLDGNGIPKDAKGRVAVGARIVESALSAGIPKDWIYLDPLVMPVGVDGGGINLFRETLMLAKEELGVKISCAPDNVSFGLPATGLVDQALTIMCAAWGVDLVLVELDEQMIGAIRAAEMLLGQDRACRQFLKGYRAGHYKGFY